MTGDPTQGDTGDFEQAEAVATIATSEATPVITVAFNDYTQDPIDPKIVFPDGLSGVHRTVKRGASLMGWSFSEDDGASFAYGGRVAPPAGWAVIWGDPALTKAQDIVYLANLAGSDDRFPSAGEVIDARPNLDGFCVARSTTAGETFDAVECFKKGRCSNTGNPCRGRFSDCFVPGPVPSVGVCNGIFYDGTALASDGDDIYFASTAVDLAEMHVWRATGHDLSGFRLLPDHSPFDIGPNEAGEDEFRIVYARTTPDMRIYLQVAFCHPDLRAIPTNPTIAECDGSGTPGGSSHASDADEFSPNLKVAAPGVWRLVYLSHTRGTSSIEVKRANFVVAGIPPVNLLPAFQLAPPQVPCTHTRAGSSRYWGDYNDLIETTSAPSGPRFLAPFTINFDDDGACEFAGEWIADMHVGAAVFQ